MPNLASARKRSRGVERKLARLLIIPNQTYSVPEAAAALGVSPISVWRWIYSGRLRRCKLGRRTIITGIQLEDLLAASEQAA
jgi:excisionase family DNA binding protein